MVWECQKAIWLCTLSQVRGRLAESKTLCMQRNFKRENRETPSLLTKP